MYNKTFIKRSLSERMIEAIFFPFVCIFIYVLIQLFIRERKTQKLQQFQEEQQSIEYRFPEVLPPASEYQWIKVRYEGYWVNVWGRASWNDQFEPNKLSIMKMIKNKQLFEAISETP